MRPFCNIYSSFMQRAYDNVIHDVAIQDLPVVLCLDRGGLVGEDGYIHGLDHFGYSAPYKVLDEQFGYNGKTVAEEVKELLGKKKK